MEVLVKPSVFDRMSLSLRQKIEQLKIKTLVIINQSLNEKALDGNFSLGKDEIAKIIYFLDGNHGCASMDDPHIRYAFMTDSPYAHTVEKARATAEVIAARYKPLLKDDVV